MTAKRMFPNSVPWEDDFGDGAEMPSVGIELFEDANSMKESGGLG